MLARTKRRQKSKQIANISVSIIILTSGSWALALFSSGCTNVGVLRCQLFALCQVALATYLIQLNWPTYWPHTMMPENSSSSYHKLKAQNSHRRASGLWKRHVNKAFQAKHNRQLNWSRLVKLKTELQLPPIYTYHYFWASNHLVYWLQSRNGRHIIFSIRRVKLW